MKEIKALLHENIYKKSNFKVDQHDTIVKKVDEISCLTAYEDIGSILKELNVGLDFINKPERQ